MSFLWYVKDKQLINFRQKAINCFDVQNCPRARQEQLVGHMWPSDRTLPKSAIAHSFSELLMPLRHKKAAIREGDKENGKQQKTQYRTYSLRVQTQIQHDKQGQRAVQCQMNTLASHKISKLCKALI